MGFGRSREGKMVILWGVRGEKWGFGAILRRKSCVLGGYEGKSEVLRRKRVFLGSL